MSKMKIKLLTVKYLETPIGGIVELETARAKYLINSKCAVEVKSNKKKPKEDGK